MTKTTYVKRPDGRYTKTIETDFGSSWQVVTTWEYSLDIATKWFLRLLTGCMWIVVALLIVAYFGYCVPYWFESILNVPVICIWKGK